MNQRNCEDCSRLMSPDEVLIRCKQGCDQLDRCPQCHDKHEEETHEPEECDCLAGPVVRDGLCAVCLGSSVEVQPSHG